MRFLYSLLVINLIAVFSFSNLSYAKKSDFYTWLNDLRIEAVEFGISPELVNRALPNNLKPIKKIIKLDRRQPEKVITFEMYKNRVINNRRVKNGRSYLQSNRLLLNKISNKYGVDSQYIIALWGMETSYGKNTGGFSVVKALLTLSYDGRRSKFFRKELLRALKIIDDKNISLKDMKGSWAGAMGQCQFMPSSYEAYAQDYNGDGKKDIWNTREDVFASIANYLHRSGWKKNQPMMIRVSLPRNFDNSLIGFKNKKSFKAWNSMGVRLINGSLLGRSKKGKFSIIQPGGIGYKTYIAYNNYRVILKWNRSLYFATSIALLADSFRQ